MCQPGGICSLSAKGSCRPGTIFRVSPTKLAVTCRPPASRRACAPAGVAATIADAAVSTTPEINPCNDRQPRRFSPMHSPTLAPNPAHHRRAHCATSRAGTSVERRLRASGRNANQLPLPSSSNVAMTAVTGGRTLKLSSYSLALMTLSLSRTKIIGRGTPCARWPGGYCGSRSL